MKSTRYDGTDARTVLSGMIMDDVVSQRIASKWVIGGLFDSEWLNLAGGLVVRHVTKHGTAPKRNISSIFEQWAIETTAQEESVKLVEQFLVSLSNSYREETTEHVLDVAGRYFNKVKLTQELDAAKSEIDRGLVTEARERLRKLESVNLGTGSYVEPAKDSEAWINAFDRTRRRPLFRLRGALGEFVGDLFQRGTLNSIMAPDKTGKTRWLIDWGYQAARQRCRVAHFDLGDGDNEEVLLRLGIRSAAQPEYHDTIRIPTEWGEDNIPKFIETELPGLDPMVAFRMFRDVCKFEDVFRVSSHSMLTVDGANRVLDDWERGGWRPDVVIFDYADLFAPPKGIVDKLQQIDETWIQMARMAKERHVCVLTATQSASSAYHKKGERELLGREDFAGRKTKLAHVDAMLCLNMSGKDRENDITRVNFIARRKGRYSENVFCRVAGCAAIGNPNLISKMG